MTLTFMEWVIPIVQWVLVGQTFVTVFLIAACVVNELLPKARD